jgi:hypothetical protein
MFDLTTIKFINSPKESKKIQKRAKALNAGKKLHPKNWEKTGSKAK